MDEQDIIIYGTDAGDRLSNHRGVAIGDLNNDGLMDIVLGAVYSNGFANSRNESGEAYVLFGPFSPDTQLDLNTTPADVTVYAADSGDWLGRAVASEDVSGDGIDNLIFSAVWADGPGNSRSLCGEVYVIFGP